MSRFTASLATLFLGTAVLLAPAWAAVGREEAVSLAQRQAPGRVLAVERGLHMDNSVIWRIRLLTAAGEVRLVVVDAETGRIR